MPMMRHGGSSRRNPRRISPLNGRRGTEERKESHRNVLLYVVGETPADGAMGLTITGLTFRNAHSECPHLRYESAKNEITNVSFENC
jgi:hypothetical protein